MDWNLFWSAFGAIGTTVGSLITACAVLIAVKQYRQPLEKRIKVDVCAAISSDMLGNILEFVCISIKNKGVRTIQIKSVNIQGNGKVLWLNNAQYESNVKVEFPTKIEPEECKDYYFERGIFKAELKKAIEKGVINPNKKLIVFATDSIGDRYFCKTKLKVGNLLR